MVCVAEADPTSGIALQPPFDYPLGFNRKMQSLPAEFAVLDDVYVLPHGQVIWNDLLLSDALLYLPASRQQAGELRLEADNFELQMGDDAKSLYTIRRFEEPTVILTNFRGGNFYHFCHEVLGKTLCLEAIEAGGSPWRVAAPRLRYPMMAHLLPAFLGDRPVSFRDNWRRGGDCVAHYRRAAIIRTPAGEITLCLPALRHVRQGLRGLVPATESQPMGGPVPGETPDLPALRHVRRRGRKQAPAAERPGIAAQAAPKRLDLPPLRLLRSGLGGVVTTTGRQPIYVSRRDGRSRTFGRIFSDDTATQVSALMARHGVREVVVSEMTVEEQLAAFGHASAIIGLHGAGLTNLLFAPDGCTVIEIGGVPVTNNNFARAAQAFGFRHIYVPSTLHDDGLKPDLDALVLALRHLHTDLA